MTSYKKGMMAAAGNSGPPDYVGEPHSSFLGGWFRADEVVESAGDISQWTDKSGNGRHRVPQDTNYKPTLNASDSNFNDHPSITFPNTGSFNFKFASGPFTTSTPWSKEFFGGNYDTAMIFVVFRTATTGNNYSYAEIWGGQQGYYWVGPGSATHMSFGNNTLQQSGHVVGTTYSTLVYRNNSTGITTMETTGLTTVSQSLSWNTGDQNQSPLIGGSQYPGQYFRGEIAEVLLYSANTDPIRTQTKNYIANSYGLTW